MSRRLVIITEIISPYRIPLFNALSERNDVDLHVIFLAETDPGLRQWDVYKNEIKFSYEVLLSWRRQIAGYNLLLNFGISRALRRARPDAVVCGGYNYPASWQALIWSRVNGVPFYLWSESHLGELHRGRTAMELLKTEFLHRCSGFVVPGKAARQYLLGHRIKSETIFTAVNAVDNDFYGCAIALVRKNAEQIRRRLQLPQRYFLFVGRLVKEKGVYELLSAYAKLDGSLREQIGLVFVGDGASRRQLEHDAGSVSPGEIRFAGFQQREQLAAYYVLADMLILPTYSDTWGLVVNEAMACELPIIIGRPAGCIPDLVTDGWNGLIVPAKDVSALSSAMQRLASQADLRASMAANSGKRIVEYCPAAWANAIAEMLQASGVTH